MKKYILLIISIIIFIIKFLDNWFRHELLDLGFLQILFYIFLVFICTIVLIVLIVIKINNKKGSNEDRFALCFLCATFCFFFIPMHEVRTRVEFESLLDERIKVIEKIKAGDLLPNKYGEIVDLDKEYKKASPCNRVKVYKNDEDGVIISFYLRCGGTLGNDVELIYTTGGKESIIENKKDRSTSDPIIQLKEEWFYVIEY